MNGAPHPRRIQLSRRKGWRMPANTAKVDRTSRWGNYPAARAQATGTEAVRLFAQWVERDAPDEWKRAALLALKDRNLACWCKVGAPCHADFLLTWISNAAKAPHRPVA